MNDIVKFRRAIINDLFMFRRRTIIIYLTKFITRTIIKDLITEFRRKTLINDLTKLKF